ncbi:MAG: protein-L-isoaspartate O-methyltransferase [Cognatishimia sp.]|uniref:protein-L-isoaspartate O-methyltransferase family protein n=1 Tax=Cognatishimia sp. TaxID=2211648 RepID=UPI003B8DCFED
MPDYTTRRIAMVDTQVRPSDVTKFPIIQAMLSVPREQLVAHDLKDVAYLGNNLDVDDGRVVLEPRTFAKMLDALDIRKNELVLDIGTAYGYSSAVIAQMAEAVIAVEDDDARARDAQSALIDLNYDNVVVHQGPLAEGAAEHGPFDVIVVQGGVAEISKNLEAQLKIGGRIACLFMDGQLGEVRLGMKTEAGISWRQIFNASAPVLAGFEKKQEFSL